MANERVTQKYDDEPNEVKAVPPPNWIDRDELIVEFDVQRKAWRNQEIEARERSEMTNLNSEEQLKALLAVARCNARAEQLEVWIQELRQRAVVVRR